MTAQGLQSKGFLLLHLASKVCTHLLLSSFIGFERAVVSFGCIVASRHTSSPCWRLLLPRSQQHCRTKAATWSWWGFKPSGSYWMSHSQGLHVPEALAFSFLKPRVSLSDGSWPERLSSSTECAESPIWTETLRPEAPEAQEGAFGHRARAWIGLLR